MNCTPLHDRVLVRRLESEAKTSGGLYIPDNAQEKAQEGVIIACGDGARTESGALIPMVVRPGNRVVFGKWSGVEIRMDSEDLLIIKESDILGIMGA